MHVRLIINGKKAGRPDVRNAVQALRATGHAVDVRVTWEHGDGGRLVAEAARDGVPRVIAAGGDGSVNEIVNGLMALPVESRPEMGILPLGTANDFATACGCPLEPLAALRLAATGVAHPVDLGRCNEAYFANVASGGFGAAVTTETPVELKNFVGGGAYTLMGIAKALNFQPYACSIHTPAGEMAGEIVLGAICNGRQAGGGQPLAPEAMLDDGLLDIVALRTFPPSAVAQVVSEMLAGHGDGDYVERMRAPWMEVVAPAPIPVNLDGEPMSGTIFRFECVPGCVHMVLPADCPCLTGTR
jgi:YegS/Rv2252/BmrU family lipid kinase